MRALLALPAVVALSLAACQEAPPPPPPKPPAPKTAVPPAPAATQAPAASGPRLTPAWPQAKGDAGAVAANLFAKNYYVVMDGSGSMNEKGCSGELTKLQAARDALIGFAESLPADANLGLQVFDGRGIRDLLPLGTNNRQEFVKIVRDVKANASTPLLSAVRQAYAKILAQGARQLGYGEYHLVIVTDGAADQGQDPTPIVNQILAESPVVVQTIGFCIGSRHSLNQAGRTIYRAADNPEQLRAGLADVLAEAPQFTVTDFKK